MSYRRLAQLRDRLDAAGFATADAPPVLVRLFGLGQRVATDAARSFLTTSFDDCLALGLLRAESETVVARYRFVDYGGILLVLDPPESDGDDDPWRVMSPSGSTHTLAQAMQRQPCDAALDLGTGCGLLALLASEHSRHVVATDANPRAAELAALSAGLNRRPNVETRVGDWFESVAAETFDQIVCNPPFVVSPRHERLYRDAGLEGDAVSRRIVESIPSFLNPGGVGQVLVNWVVTDAGEPLDAWTADSGCDVLLQRLAVYDPADYARHWLGERADGPQLSAWLDYYRRLQVKALGAGILTLTKRAST